LRRGRAVDSNDENAGLDLNAERPERQVNTDLQKEEKRDGNAFLWTSGLKWLALSLS
jgi:hypothetical protein